MKKTLALLLLVTIGIHTLLGCVGTDNDKGDGKDNDTGDYYNVTVTGYESLLMEPLKPSYKAGETVEIRAGVITDTSLYVYVNGKYIPMSHYDSDYWGYEFVMPEEDITVHLTTDQFYGKNDYSFEDLYTGTDITKYDYKVTGVSISTTKHEERYSLIENRYSSKQVDIDNFKAILDQRLLKFNGYSETTYKNVYNLYCTNDIHGDRTESLCFYDSYYFWNDFSSSQDFKFEDESYVLPTIEDPDLVTYSFKYDHRSSDIKRYDDEDFLLKYYSIGNVEFVPYEGEPIEKEAKFYIDSGYGKINLITSTLFELNGEYYEIVSGEERWAYNCCRPLIDQV